ncbi:hypothetical protein Q0Z83_100870 [Actinoplanes sichuanensis]|uniref:Integrase n=1 Tax=Actinoplanes sichuanensis TaxID=512349 RepID=A0ABW4AET9_9ACTN|nr:hypothetical protein [Actinoplanes sichuanensis]BEL11896.1 hypothetical protein Q0Z83_100870 [Actinoplanes sichuanensis]
MTSAAVIPLHSDEARISWAADMPAFPRDQVRPDVLASGARLPRYGDDEWALSLLDHGDSPNSLRVTWSTFPARFRETFRAAGWTMINKGLNPDLINLRNVGLVSHPAPGTAHVVIAQWRLFARWLEHAKPSIESLSEVEDADLRAWATHLRETYAAETTRLQGLVGVTRLYGHSWLIGRDAQIMRPPWLGTGYKRFIGEATRRTENSTPPISSESISTLLTCAIDCIDDFLKTYGNKRNPSLRNREITRITAASITVIAYLTGMRPQEVLSLRTDCLKIVENDTGGIRYEVRGRAFKNVRDDEGRQLTQGRARKQPWLTIEAGARAIRAAAIAAKATDSSGLLFPRLRMRKAVRQGGALTVAVANNRITDFVSHVNAVLAPQTGRKPIDVESEGNITLRRFRRTLAFHIARQPLGEVALGVQYGHLNIVTGQGYAGRSEAGLQGLIDFERMTKVVELLDSLVEEQESGTTVSGPAAARLSSALMRYETDFAGTTWTDKEAKRMRKTPGLQIFDNPNTMVLCVFDAATSRCHAGTSPSSTTRSTPALDNCARSCANIARTDRHIAALREEREGLATEATQVPEPIAARLHQRIADIDQIVHDHKAAA